MTDGRFQLAQIARFASVGMLATLVHAASYTLMAEFAGMEALLANWLAFVTAFGISLFGHSYWTFGTKLSSNNGFRFLLIALMGLLANTGFVYLIVDVLSFRPAAALPFLIFVTPALTYLAARFWAFS